MPSVDERVVSMQFDNRQFERGVGSTLKSLDKLKRGLNLESSAKGLEHLARAGKNFSLDNISSSIEKISSKFTGLGMLGVMEFRKIADAALNAGNRIAKSLTIEPITTGFNEYELKMNSVQTIMSSTGKSLGEVNKYLEELNAYSDRTIYSFQDMTSNIGKFTNAGVSLDDAVMAIKGISNEAAVSGANANEASRAMYNFSQALSSGTIRLIDWKSIENANMATKEFKQELLDTALALGTVKQGQDGMYKAGKTTFDATKKFNDSLQEQWMTSEVLIETLKRYSDESTDIGKKAYAAAQDVKTFTQLYDTLKEAAQSGWAQSWEIVVGDLSEAKNLLTKISNVVGGMIGRSAEMRNNLLTGWDELGGRLMLIEAGKNAFEALNRVIKPIKAAFRDIFPKVTAENLFSMTKGLLKFTESIKLSIPMVGNLRHTFRGVFAVLDIVKQAFTAAFNAIKPLFGTAGEGLSKILEFTASLGDSLVELDESIRQTDTFGQMFKALVSYVAPATKAIVDFGKSVVDIFKGLDLTTVFGFIGKGIEYVTQRVTEFVKRVKDSISMSNIDGFDILNAGVFSGILVGIKKIVDIFAKFGKDKAKFLDGLKDVMSSISDTLGAFQDRIQADTLSKIAKAVAILAGSLIILSLVDMEDLGTALIGLASTMGGLYFASSLLMGIFSKFRPATVGKMAAGINSIAAAILLMSTSLVILSTIDATEMFTGVLAIGGILTAFALFSKYMSKNKIKVRSMDGIKDIAFSMIEFAAAMKIISTIDIDGIGRSLFSIGAILAMIWAFSKYTSGGASLIGVGIGMGIVAGALVLMAGAMKVLSMLSLPEIGVSLLAMAGALVALAVAANGMIMAIPGAIAMGIMAGALLLLVPSLMALGSMSLGEIGKSLLVLSGALVSMALAGTLMVLALPGAFAMIMMSKAILMLVPSLVALGKLKMSEIAKSLFALSSAFVLIGISGVVLGVLSPLLLAAGAALVVFSVGLLGVGAAIGLFAAGMSVLAVSGEVGAAALVASLKTILGIIPVVAIGIGEGIITIAQVITKGAPIIGMAVTTVILAIVTTLAASAPVLVDGGLKIVTSILMGIANNLEQVIYAAGLVIVKFLNGIGQLLPMVVQAGIDLVVNFINGMANGIRDNSEKVFLAVGNLISSIVEMALTGLQLLVEKIPGVGEKMAEGLESAKEAVRSTLTSDEMVNSGSEAIAKIETGVKNESSTLEDAGSGAGSIFKEGFDNAILSEGGITESLKTAFTPESLGMEGISEQLTTTLTTGLEGASGAIKGEGQESAGSYATGIKMGNSKASSAGSGLAGAGVSGAGSKDGEFKAAGENTAYGFANGMRTGTPDVSTAAGQMAQAAIDAVKNKLKIMSPSRVMFESGMYTDMGMADGMVAFASLVSKSGTEVGQSAIDGISGVIAKASDIISQEIDPNPTIRPVLDLSNIQNGTRTLGSMLNSMGTLNLGNATAQVSSISLARKNARKEVSVDASESGTSGSNVTYVQNNYSPKALSRIDIYRQTKNLISQKSSMKGVVKTV